MITEGSVVEIKSSTLLKRLTSIDFNSWRSVAQFDSFKLNKFKKIADRRTLSRYDIGTVYYAKINRQLEIYNSDGFHPIDTNRGRRPLTDDRFNK